MTRESVLKLKLALAEASLAKEVHDLPPAVEVKDLYTREEYAALEAEKERWSFDARLLLMKWLEREKPFEAQKKTIAALQAENKRLKALLT